jgi:EAL domain-containing protein (putative c-di-GMP-specific phosphodiesterase class I)
MVCDLMGASWFGLERVAGMAERNGHLGLIGIDLSDFTGGFFSDIREDDFDWTRWIASSMGRTDLWFGDEIGTHLWLYAEYPRELPEVEEEAYLHGLARRFREAIATLSGEKVKVNGESVHSLERGIGYAKLMFPNDRNPRDAIYEGVLKASAQMSASLQDRRDLELRFELERILRDCTIRSVYQPITRLSDGRIFGYESLTRCQEGSLFDGPLSLFKFAERENQSYTLDRLARESAIRHCPTLGTMQKIFINVTMGIMNDPHFVSGQTIKWLSDRGLRPGQVVFELTERSSIDDFDAAKKILAHYRSQGYEIAIDDAGAGYSSLQSIVELNPDYIKIDRSLVKFADKDEMKKHMLRTFVRFAKKMNIRTVAEGIERPEELRLLRAMGFDYGQGYLIGRPSDKPAIESAAGLPNG